MEHAMSYYHDHQAPLDYAPQRLRDYTPRADVQGYYTPAPEVRDEPERPAWRDRDMFAAVATPRYRNSLYSDLS